MISKSLAVLSVLLLTTAGAFADPIAPGDAQVGPAPHMMGIAPALFPQPALTWNMGSYGAPGASSAQFPAPFDGTWEVNDNIVVDTTNLPVGYQAVGQLFRDHFGGSNLTGERAGFVVSTDFLNSPANNSYGSHDYISLLTQFTVNVAAGYTTDSVYALNPVLVSDSGATGWSCFCGAEWDFLIQSGSSAKYVIGQNMVYAGSQQPSIWSAAFEIGGGSAGSTSGWKYGLLVGNLNGSYPILSTGTIIGTDGSNDTVGNGIDFSSFTITTCLLKGPGNFCINGSGAIASTQETFRNTSAGVGGNNNLSLAVGTPSTLAVFTGLYVIRDTSIGGTVLVLVSTGDVAATIISQTGSNFVTTDPGAGGNKIFISPSTGTLTNRFTSVHNVSYFAASANGLVTQ